MISDEMISPPIFSLLYASSAVKTLLGTSPLRVYEFGEAPQKVVLPYLVWQIVAGVPENFLGDVPDMDSYTTQVDVYGETTSSVKAIVKAVASAIEGDAHVTSWYGTGTEPDTKYKRASFAADWFTKRD